MRKKEIDEQLLYEKNTMIKQQIKEGIIEGKTKHFSKVKEEAEVLKEQKQEAKEMIEM